MAAAPGSATGPPGACTACVAWAVGSAQLTCRFRSHGQPARCRLAGRTRPTCHVVLTSEPITTTDPYTPRTSAPRTTTEPVVPSELSATPYWVPEPELVASCEAGPTQSHGCSATTAQSPAEAQQPSSQPTGEAELQHGKTSPEPTTQAPKMSSPRPKAIFVTFPCPEIAIECVAVVALSIGLQYASSSSQVLPLLPNLPLRSARLFQSTADRSAQNFHRGRVVCIADGALDGWLRILDIDGRVVVSLR